MKILVMDKMTAKVSTLEFDSTDTIAHLKAKMHTIPIRRNLMFDGKQLGEIFSENMMLADFGIQDGSLILDSSPGYFCEIFSENMMLADFGIQDGSLILDSSPGYFCEIFSENMMLADFGIQDGSLILDSSPGYFSASRPERQKRRPENDYLYYADAFKSGWREEHAKALLHLLLELCQAGTISEGNVTDEAWLRIQNSLKNSMKCSFQIDFLKERLCDYKQLYSVLTETSSPFFKWDRERKIITIDTYCNWREEYPELLLLCGPHIPYFDTLEEVCLLVNTTRSSEQRVSEILTNINNAREASSSREEIFIRRPSDSNLSLMGSSTLIGKENGYLPSTMKILVVEWNAKVFSVERELMDTIAHLKAKLDKIVGDHSHRLMFDGKQLGDKFSDNMTLADVGVQDGSFIFRGSREPSFIEHEVQSAGVIILLSFNPDIMQCMLAFLVLAQLFSSRIERPRRPRSPQRVPEKDYLYYADAFKSGWREEHAKALLHLLLELCQDGTISEGNVTDEAWLRIQNSLKNSMKCSFQIDFLKERLRDYKQLYSVLADTTTSIFRWDRERKTITICKADDSTEQYPELLLLCGPYIPYFDTLEEVCLLLNAGQSSEQRVSDTSTNRKRLRQDIPRLSKLRSLFCLYQRN